MTNLDFDPPRLYVDLNEMVDIQAQIVLLSREDVKIDSAGNRVELSVGMRVLIWSDDADDAGSPDPILGEGVVELNQDHDGWSRHVKWCCRIAGDLRWASDV